MLQTLTWETFSTKHLSRTTDQLMLRSFMNRKSATRVWSLLRNMSDQLSIIYINATSSTQHPQSGERTLYHVK